MSVLVIRWQDVEGLRRFDNAIKALGEKDARKVMNRAINRTGDMARTRVRKALVKQTGLPSRYIGQKLKQGTSRSNWGNLTYRINVRGGDIPLHFYKPRETRSGVTARLPEGKKLFPGAFMKAGHFPIRRRVTVAKFHGNVFEPIGGTRHWGRPIKKVDSGISFPKELVSGESAKAWDEVARTKLPERVSHEISRLTKGAVT